MLLKSQFDTKEKSKILAGLAIAIVLISVPMSLQLFISGYGTHISIHIISIILGGFLTTIGIFTFKQFRSTRLFLVMCAFLTITIMETIVLSTLILNLDAYW